MLFKIIVFIFLVVILLMFLGSVKICDGGALFKGCGKLLFPWTKKYKISKNSYCCENCLKRDFYIYYSEEKDPKVIFTEKEEYDGIDQKDS